MAGNLKAPDLKEKARRAFGKSRPRAWAQCTERALGAGTNGHQRAKGHQRVHQPRTLGPLTVRRLLVGLNLKGHGGLKREPSKKARWGLGPVAFKIRRHQRAPAGSSARTNRHQCTNSRDPGQGLVWAPTASAPKRHHEHYKLGTR